MALFEGVVDSSDFDAVPEEGCLGVGQRLLEVGRITFIVGFQRINIFLVCM